VRGVLTWRERACVIAARAPERVPVHASARRAHPHTHTHTHTHAHTPCARSLDSSIQLLAEKYHADAEERRREREAARLRREAAQAARCVRRGGADVWWLRPPTHTRGGCRVGAAGACWGRGQGAPQARGAGPCAPAAPPPPPPPPGGGGAAPPTPGGVAGAPRGPPPPPPAPRRTRTHTHTHTHGSRVWHDRVTLLGATLRAQGQAHA
jgi:hypothetical protein